MSQEDHAAAAHFTRTEVASVLVLGVIGGMVPLLQPLLLGQLAAEGRLTVGQMGQAAMVEALGMAIAAGIAGAWLKPEPLKVIAGGATILALIANIITTHLSGDLILLARLVVGVCAGLIIWVWMGLLTRVAVPARLIAIYITVLGVVTMVLASLFASVLVPRFGVNGGYGALAGLNVVMLALCLFIPTRYAVSETSSGIQLPPPRGWIALFAVFLHLGAIMAVWVYVVPLGRQGGISDTASGLSVSLALGSQIAAGLLAAAVATRLTGTVAVLAAIAASLVALFLLAFVPGELVFTAAVVLFAFFWMMAPPFQMPYLLGVDPSGRAGMQMATAQTLGVAMGPALASVFVTATDARGALVVSAALFVASAVIVVFTSASARLSPAPTAPTT